MSLFLHGLCTKKQSSDSYCIYALIDSRSLNQLHSSVLSTNEDSISTNPVWLHLSPKKSPLDRGFDIMTASETGWKRDEQQQRLITNRVENDGDESDSASPISTEFIGELINAKQNDVKRSMSGLKKKLWTKSQRFVLSSQVWLHAVPTRNCDVLITLPSKDPNAEQTVTWIVQQIRSKEPKLIIEARYHTCTDSYGLYLTARYENLLKGAELLHLGKRLKSQFGGGLKEFVYEEAECFVGVENRNQFLNSQERASIVLCLLEGISAGNAEYCGSLRLREGQPIVPALLSAGLISQVTPLHNSEQLKRLGDSWYKHVLKQQPLDDIEEYFGVKIAMYFAWLNHYTLALTIPAFFGFFYWLLVQGRNNFLDDLCFVAFAMLNMIWSTVFLEWWKRAQAVYAYRWGTLFMEDDLLAEPRPEYRGELQPSPVTGRLEPSYPAWKRRVFRYCLSFPLTFTCLFVVFLSMLMVFELQGLVDRYFANKFAFNWVTLVPQIILAVIIHLADEVYSGLAVWLNDIENYRTDRAYENMLIRKTVVFQFITGFLALFYIAFYLQDMDRLRTTLAALLITRQVIGNVREAFLPFIMEKIKLSRMTYQMTKSMSDESLQRHVQTLKRHSEEETESPVSPTASPRDDLPPSALPPSTQALRNRRVSRALALPEFKQSGPQLCQAEVESYLPKYSSPLEDYLEMFVQFGYVVLFSPAFPLAAGCALLNNILEIRVDAFKLCTTLQRPFAHRVQNIGAWQTNLELMGVIGVMVNCALIAQSGLIHRLMPDLSWGGQILLIIILEHAVLALKMGISEAIPDVPQWVKVEMAKVEFLRREALRKETRLHLRTSQDTEPDQRAQNSASMVTTGDRDGSTGKQQPRSPAPDSLPLRSRFTDEF